MEILEKDNNENNNEITNQTIIQKDNINNNQTTTQENKRKSRIAAGLFGIFLGVFGVHNFYLGFTGKAVAQLLITVLSFGILSFVSYIWGLIEGILILTKEINEDADRVTLRD